MLTIAPWYPGHVQFKTTAMPVCPLTRHVWDSLVGNSVEFVVTCGGWNHIKTMGRRTIYKHTQTLTDMQSLVKGKLIILLVNRSYIMKRDSFCLSQPVWPMYTKLMCVSLCLCVRAAHVRQVVKFLWVDNRARSAFMKIISLSLFPFSLLPPPPHRPLPSSFLPMR